MKQVFYTGLNEGKQIKNSKFNKGGGNKSSAQVGLYVDTKLKIATTAGFN